MGRFSRLFASSTLVLALPLVFAQTSAQSNAPQQTANDTAAHLPNPQQPASTSEPTPELSVPPPPEDATAVDLEKKGDLLRLRKDYLDSIDYYRAAMKKDESAVLHNKVGICLLLLQRNSEARKEFQQAVKLDKSYAEAYNNLGALYYNDRKYGPAVKEYKRAIKLNQGNASFHCNLGTAYFSQKDFGHASKEYERAMALDPNIFDHSPSGGVAVKLISSSDLGRFHYLRAQMYAQHGDMARCRYYLSKANEVGYPIKGALRDDEFATFRKDPSFIAFVRSLKPPQAESSN